MKYTARCAFQKNNREKKEKDDLDDLLNGME